MTADERGAVDEWQAEVNDRLDQIDLALERYDLILSEVRVLADRCHELVALRPRPTR